MRLRRIASIVIISTGVAAPAPGPAGDGARAVFDRSNTVHGTTRLAQVITPKRDSRLAAAVSAAVPQEHRLQPASNSAANLRRSVEDRSAERYSAEPKAAAASDSAAAGKRALNGKGTVQLGAFTSEAAALAAWAKIGAASDGALGGLAPITVPVPAKAHLWRLRTTVSDLTAARNLCAALVHRKQVCVVAKD